MFMHLYRFTASHPTGVQNVGRVISPEIPLETKLVRSKSIVLGRSSSSEFPSNARVPANLENSPS